MIVDCNRVFAENRLASYLVAEPTRLIPLEISSVCFRSDKV